MLYLSPLRALAVDIEKNLRAPLQGIRSGRPSDWARSVHTPHGRDPYGRHVHPVTAAKLVRHPPDILITTPESLFLMLTSRARETLDQRAAT